MSKKKAVALTYKDNYNTPVVTAMGIGQIAENIIKLAEDSDIPVIENTELTEKLSKIPPSSEIPPELYEAVAEIIAFIYYIDSNSSLKDITD